MRRVVGEKVEEAAGKTFCSRNPERILLGMADIPLWSQMKCFSEVFTALQEEDEETTGSFLLGFLSALS